MPSEPIETGNDKCGVRPDGKGQFKESVVMANDGSDRSRAKLPRLGAASGVPRVRTTARSGAAVCAS